MVHRLDALRLRLVELGYSPVPAQGKAPRLPGWRQLCAAPDADQIRRWRSTFDYPREGKPPGTYRGSQHTNTGLLCGILRGVDIDVLDPDLAAEIEVLAVRILGATPLRRVGRAPKLCLAYRAATPGPKVMTADLVLPDGNPARVEILGEGQHFIAFGDHPDTGQPYQWTGGAEPTDVPLADLPEISDQRVRDFVAEAEALIRQAGGRERPRPDGAAANDAAPVEAPAQPAAATPAAPVAVAASRPRKSGGSPFFREVNRRALGDIGAWFPVLFSKARQEAGTGAWRVSSRDLGRWPQIEEDLAMHPTSGGRDFGTDESCSPVDVVIRWGGAPDAQRAAFWLCERLGIAPADCGWKAKRDKPAPDPSELDGFDLTEDGVALAFTAKHRDVLRYCHDTGAWFEWTGAKWRQDRTKLAFSWARAVCRHLAQEVGLTDGAQRTLAKASTAAAVERFAQADRAFAVTAETWDPDPFLLGTPDGTVDLRTGELRPARREDLITRLAAVAPAERADCPRWLRFMEEVTGGDAGLIRFLRQWFGYSLTGVTREHALIFVHGPGGNGKSVFLNTMAGIAGEYATTAAMDTLTEAGGSRHLAFLAMLNGARIVSASETEEGRAWAEVRIKQLTGGDPVTANFMRRDPFTFTPRFKLVVIGNHKPVLRNVDDAARRRFNIIPFDFKPSPKDPELEERLRREWPGILRWAIDGCLDWQRNRLVRPAVLMAATEDYFAEQDVFASWAAECCIFDPNLTERPGKLLTSFNAWAERNGVERASRPRFRGWADRRGMRHKRINGADFVQGLGLKPDQSGGRWEERE
jgi:P4 family phage/plasmid primase-like protien